MNVNEAILKRVRERALADLKPWPDKLKELFEEGGLLTATAGSHSSEVQKLWNEEPPGVTVHTVEIRVATAATGSQSAGGKRWRSRTARSLVVRGRPPARAAGRTGATQVHAALVRSVS